jgi:hypothetical protein
VDYLLCYERNFPLAVVEAKAAFKSAGDGLQQAKEYAEMLGLKFAYATNGSEIVEFDYLTGRETVVMGYPTPAALWTRYRTGAKVADDTAAERLLTPMNHSVGKGERYYQEIAVNRSVQGILAGNHRQLLTMAWPNAWLRRTVHSRQRRHNQSRAFAERPLSRSGNPPAAAGGAAPDRGADRGAGRPNRRSRHPPPGN